MSSEFFWTSLPEPFKQVIKIVPSVVEDNLSARVVELAQVRVSFPRLLTIVFVLGTFPLHDPHLSWPFALAVWPVSHLPVLVALHDPHLPNVVDQA